MRFVHRLSVVAALTAMLWLGAACGDEDDPSRVLTLPHGQITERTYRLYLRDLLSQGDTVRFCEILDSLRADEKVETVGLAPEQATPLAGATPDPEDIERAAELIDDGCEDLREFNEG